MMIESVNPATGETVEVYPETASREINPRLAAAQSAFCEWRERSFVERAAPMNLAAAKLRHDKAACARLMAQEMGKPLVQGEAEIEKCAWVCEYYAAQAERFLERQMVATHARKSFVTFQPLGIILAVMPWNFPFWQVFRAAAPALMAGNSMLLKHASNVFGCALAIERIFRSAGFPDGLFQALLIGAERTAAVIEHPLVRGVTLTGSTAAGSKVAAKAGALLKKTVLELGGSDPYVVLEDADLEVAAETCVASRLINSGQSCIAAKRFVVVKAVRENFEGLLVEGMRAQRMGDPLEDGTQVGPLARRDLRDDLRRQVEESVAKGARLLLGGSIPDGPGAFYPPTVLTAVRKGMPAFDEETFGPVAAVIEAEDEEHAIHLANDSSFGLGAAVFTRDIARGERIAAERIEAGCCFVNAFVKSDPRLPFGGVKHSGFGRELGEFGIREFVNIKTVYIC